VSGRTYSGACPRPTPTPQLRPCPVPRPPAKTCHGVATLSPPLAPVRVRARRVRPRQKTKTPHETPSPSRAAYPRPTRPRSTSCSIQVSGQLSVAGPPPPKASGRQKLIPTPNFPTAGCVTSTRTPLPTSPPTFHLPLDARGFDRRARSRTQPPCLALPHRVRSRSHEQVRCHDHGPRGGGQGKPTTRSGREDYVVSQYRGPPREAMLSISRGSPPFAPPSSPISSSTAAPPFTSTSIPPPRRSSTRPTSTSRSSSRSRMPWRR